MDRSLSTTRSSSLVHIPALDGLRGAAIAAVVASHFFGLPGGFLGVDLFFVLSGFLITGILLEEPSLTTFYARRARRLLPASLAMLAVVSAWVGPSAVARNGLYAANVLRAFTSAGAHGGSPLGHMWSLAEEEQFYAVWPFVLLLVKRRRRLLSGLVSVFVGLVVYRVGLGLHGASFNRLYFAPDTHADGLVIGCAAAVFRSRGGRVPAPLPVLGIVAVAAFFAFGELSVRLQMYGLPFFEIAAAVLVLAPPAVLAFRPLVGLGLISYSLYLWHEPVRALFHFRSTWLAFPVALAFALVSYRVVEQPFRRHRRQRSPTEAVAVPS